MLVINNISKEDVKGKTPVMTIMGTPLECMTALKEKEIQEVFCVIDELDGELIYSVYDIHHSVTQKKNPPYKEKLTPPITKPNVPHRVVDEPSAEVGDNTLHEEKTPKEKLPPKWETATPEMIVKGKLCRCKAGSNSGQIGEIVYVKREGKADCETELISSTSGARVSVSSSSGAQPISSQAQGIAQEMQLRPLFGVPDKVRINFIDPKQVSGTFSTGAVSAPLVTVTITKREFCSNWLIDVNN